MALHFSRFALAAGALALGAGLAMAVAAPPSPPGATAVVRETQPSPFGLNASAWSHLGANTERFEEATGDRRLALVAETGARWDRVDFWWGRIEPRPGEFDWRDYDKVVGKYARAGINLMPILCYASAWSGGVAPATDEERARFGRYVYSTVSRYRGRVRAWEIWNEPNIGQFWSPAPNARDYAELLKVAYREAKRADSTCTVVGAATAGIDTGFIEDLLELGAAGSMDALSVHPYQGDLGSVGPEAGGLFTDLGALKALLSRYGVRKPIWITEMGHTTRPRGKVSEDEQASYLVRSYALALAQGVERLFWFNLQDWEEHWGLVRADFSRKPSFRAYQTLTRMLGGLRAVSMLDFGNGARGVVFARSGSGGGKAERVAVIWSPDGERTVPLSGRLVHGLLGESLPMGRLKAGPRPVYVTGVRVARRYARSLPGWPALRRVVMAPEPPPLPKRVPWSEPKFAKRRLVTVAATASTAGAPLFATLDGDEVTGARVIRLDTAGRAVGVVASQADGPTRLVWMAPERVRSGEALTYAVYVDPRGEGFIGDAVSSPVTVLENEHLRFEIPDGKYIARVTDRATGWTNASRDVNGLFAASYNDSSDGWPRLGADATRSGATLLAGPVFQRASVNVRFGRDQVEYAWTLTLYNGSRRADWTGRWVNAGAGARKFVHLGASFPTGTRVVAPYAEVTLPRAGASYGKWALIPRATGQPPGTGMLLVAPGRNLQTPGWAETAITGVGSWYESAVPATFSASLFVLPLPDRSAAERLYRQVAFPPRLQVGPTEQRP